MYIEIYAHEIRRADILYGSAVKSVEIDGSLVVVQTVDMKYDFFHFEKVEVERF